MLNVGDNLTVGDVQSDSALLYDDVGGKFWTTSAAGLSYGDNLTVGEVQDKQFILYSDDGSKYTIDRG